MAVRTPKVPAPRGGWNTRDPVALMDPADAISMNNLIPDIDGVSIRPGYEQYVQLSGATASWVSSLINWKTQYGERFLAACPITAASHTLFDISTSTVATLKSGYVGSKWRHATMSGRLALVNGSDQPQELSYAPGPGVVVRDLAITGGSPNPEAFRIIHVFKSRSYFATGTEPGFWYSAVNALGGTLTHFPLDRVAETSGNVIDINSWTRDGGSGPDDFFVLFLDTGEVIVYQGSNPGSASDWALVGRYKLGKVLTSVQFAGKIHVVTDEDYNILPDDLLTEGVRVPSKMSGAARDAVKRDASTNWQILFDTEWGWRIINVPQGTAREQHILNLRSGGPSRFTIEANVWCRYKGDLYFGGKSARVHKIREGDDNGTAIEWSCQQAFTDFGTPRVKGVRNYRPMWQTFGALTVGSGIAYDYDTNDFIQTGSTTTVGPPWNTSPWNTTSWGQGHPIMQDWLCGAGMGQNVSLVQSGTSTKKATWHHTDYRIEIGEDVF